MNKSRGDYMLWLMSLASTGRTRVACHNAKAEEVISKGVSKLATTVEKISGPAARRAFDVTGRTLRVGKLDLQLVESTAQQAVHSADWLGREISADGTYPLGV